MVKKELAQMSLSRYKGQEKLVDEGKGPRRCKEKKTDRMGVSIDKGARSSSQLGNIQG